MRRRRVLALLPVAILALVFLKLLLFVSPRDPVAASSIVYQFRTERSRELAIQELIPLPLPSPVVAGTLPSPAAAAEDVTESILFPGWEVFVLLPSDSDLAVPDVSSGRNLTCLFQDGATSPARYGGRVPSSGRHGFLCGMPRSVQGLRRPFLTPKLICQESDTAVIGGTKMFRWDRLAYESFSTPDDVVVFVKGVNNMKVDRDVHPEKVTCVFATVVGDVVASTAATSSAQEVFRCPHPPNYLSLDGAVRVSVKVAGQEAPFPSLAVYHAPPPPTSEPKQLTCACTMVYNVAKFLKEWVAYHKAIGVDKFVFYDNGSDDSLASVLGQLSDEGYDVGSVYWPWQKTQEAGFSHFVSSHLRTCKWTAFIDVDEFIYSPAWSGSAEPPRRWSMIGLLIEPDADRARTGQVLLGCHDFAPSGQRAHPKAGVTQGYTFRLRKVERHKSIVRLEAVLHSLKNSVHHFEVGPEWTNRKERVAVVNHYKHQAWSEFRMKYRRRASAYVMDWKDKRSVGSRDRTPALEFGEVKPVDWESRYCEVEDVGLREVVKRWFADRSNGRLPWE